MLGRQLVVRQLKAVRLQVKAIQIDKITNEFIKIEKGR